MTEPQSLVQQVIAGDAGARTVFYDRYYRLVWGTFHKMAIPEQDAQELFSLFFIRLFDNDCHALRLWKGDSIESYVCRIARNLAIDFLRTKRTEQSRATTFHTTPPDASANDAGEERVKQDAALRLPASDTLLLVKELEQATRDALALLPERDRELIRRFYFEEETYEEIAAAMQMTSSNVGVALKRAREKVKTALSKFPELFGPTEIKS